MIDPDRFKVDLDLGDGRTPLKLWYTPGAIRKICEKLPREVPFGDIAELLAQFNPTTLPLFVWGGRLWEDRKASMDELAERVDGAMRPLLDIWADVQGALLLGLTGKPPKEEAKPDPQRPAALNGAGTTASSSPSASSVSQ